MIELQAKYDKDTGALCLEIWNGDYVLHRPVLNYVSQFYPTQDAHIEGARIVKQDGGAIWLAKDADFASDETWRVRITPLANAPKNMSQGVREAVLWVDNIAHSVLGLPLRFEDEVVSIDVRTDSIAPTPQIGIMPWPNGVHIEKTAKFRGLALSELDRKSRNAAINVAALYGRLYPTAPAIFADGKNAHKLTIQTSAALSPSAYELHFITGDVRLVYGDDTGLHYGLISLAQMAHFTRYGFSWIDEGRVTDAPRFQWRGFHLDVSRHFFEAKTVQSLLDIAAWLKFNQFHWHLTDDEGWRLPSKRFPKLNEIASWRGPKTELSAQYSHLAAKYGWFYSVEDIQLTISHAAKFHIAVMPEIDLPGHSKALLAAYPELIDTDETAMSYHSVQGYANNALNPANPAIYPFLREVIEEACGLFPASYFHIGGDEVAEGAWHQSPMAQAYFPQNRLTLTHDLQNEFTRKIADIVEDCGKMVAAWDECGDGDALLSRRALLFAWRDKETVTRLLQKGFDVVATPGQAYYLDMAYSHSSQGYGATWAGVASLADCYQYEVPDDSEYEGRLVGVQAGIWTESMPNEGALSAMVFPRFYAIAERAWTKPSQCDFARFEILERYLPRWV